MWQLMKKLIFAPYKTYTQIMQIRKYKHTDIERVIKIWLECNLQAHSFISASYWKSNINYVRKVLPNSEVYVYSNGQTVIAFAGLDGDYIEGIFVVPGYQSKGIGRELIDYLKNLHNRLFLSVYKKNEDAIRFYTREKFSIAEERTDENTREKEYLMCWQR